MEVEDLEDTLVQSQEWEVYQEMDKNQALEKSREKIKRKKILIQAIGHHMEALDQDLKDHMGQDQDLEVHMDQDQDLKDHMGQDQDLEDHMDQDQDLEDHMDQDQDLEDHMDQNQDLEDHMGQNQDLEDHMDQKDLKDLESHLEGQG